jgi:hypothetical protein
MTLRPQRLLLTRLIRLGDLAATVIGVVAAVVLFGAHLMYEQRQNIVPSRP